jgi:hypothetical protein
MLTCQCPHNQVKPPGFIIQVLSGVHYVNIFTLIILGGDLSRSMACCTLMQARASPDSPQGAQHSAPQSHRQL